MAMRVSTNCNPALKEKNVHANCLMSLAIVSSWLCLERLFAADMDCWRHDAAVPAGQTTGSLKRLMVSGGNRSPPFSVEVEFFWVYAQSAYPVL